MTHHLPYDAYEFRRRDVPEVRDEPDRTREPLTEHQQQIAEIRALRAQVGYSQEKIRLTKLVRQFRDKISTINPATTQPIDQPEHLQPEKGYFWDVRRVTANSFTAGSITMYSTNEPVAAEVEGIFTSIGTLTYSKAGLIIEGGSSQRLVFQPSATIAGLIDIGVRGILVPMGLLEDYIS